ncbi:MAG: F0F1 ATP synthase subunit delta [Verrucomicrobia bacterium]|nr:F0F1 ATP synthase subunit delta [Verrucomicrobiota bacterium]
MKIGKQARRDGKDLYRACLRDGMLDEARVRQTVDQVIQAKPRNHLAALQHFLSLVKIDVGRRTARMESAVDPSPEVKASIRETLGRRYGQGLEFQFSVQPAHIGGLRVQVGNDVYDGTVKARLAALEKSF